MARKPRVHYPAALYHVIMRGNARQDIFFDDDDRCRFFLLLQEGGNWGQGETGETGVRLAVIEYQNVSTTN